MSKSFRDIRQPNRQHAEPVAIDPIVDDETLSESFLRKGAALAFGARSKTHGDKVISQINLSNQKLNFGNRKDLDASEKLDIIADALMHQNQGIIELRRQLGAAVSVSVSTALFVERIDGKRR